jgi:hypothetical protein
MLSWDATVKFTFLSPLTNILYPTPAVKFVALVLAIAVQPVPVY